MNTTPRPRAILFDWDNTLVDNWPVIRDSMNDALTAMGHPVWTLEETMARVRASLRDSFPRMFGDRWPEAREIFYRSFTSRHLAALKPMAGAERLLRSLRDRDIYLAVVSNKTGRYLRAEAEHLGWQDFFGALVGAGDCPQDKPARAPVEFALAPTGTGADASVWFVGDTDIDMVCAIASGCWPVLLRADPPGEGEFAEARPSLYLQNCESLGRYIERL
jgi:phosphoglycolate phosphatase